MKPYKTQSAAEKKARQISTNPQIVRMPNGWAALGDIIVRMDGSVFRLVYGREGTCYLSELPNHQDIEIIKVR